MTHKSPHIAQFISAFEGQSLPAHYLGYFDCFNRQEFYQAHDVLEDLWLDCRGGDKDLFYKSLIQYAGAFVHLKNGRRRPARSLLSLARGYLVRFAPAYESLDVALLIDQIDCWLERLERLPENRDPLEQFGPPHLSPSAPRS